MNIADLDQWVPSDLDLHCINYIGLHCLHLNDNYVSCMHAMDDSSSRRQFSKKRAGLKQSQLPEKLGWNKKQTKIMRNSKSLGEQLTLCMLGNFFKYVFLSKDAKNQCFLLNILLIYNLNVKQFGSQKKPHILWGFIWIQIVCIGYQRSSKFTASGLRVKFCGPYVILLPW